MAEVFISYAREDQGFASDLNAALQKLQRETWIDWRSIPDSAKWRGEIFAAIEAADNFLFVISPDSVKSWMCGQEVSHAVANNKRLITVLYHSVERKELLPANKIAIPFVIWETLCDRNRVCLRTQSKSVSIAAVNRSKVCSKPKFG